ncbi:MAG: hypothetical protein GXP54_07180, partial [Deltaproteobacteria bacterium]|nr:hypothetical protein [Deltaproteobacteria bacterium]
MKRFTLLIFLAFSAHGCSSDLGYVSDEGYDGLSQDTTIDAVTHDVPPGDLTPDTPDKGFFDTSTDICACDTGTDANADEAGEWDTFDPGTDPVGADVSDQGIDPDVMGTPDSNDDTGTIDTGADDAGAPDACSYDNDCDGIAADKDNCPDTYNPDQLDTDQDSKGDACDDDDDNDGDPDKTDCEPLNPAVHAGALDLCNSKD